MKSILIAYYTRSGNTRKIAELIQAEVGGTLFEITPQVPYPASYNAVVAQAKKEIRAAYKPALQSKIDNIRAYDTVFIGSPNWWSTLAPPVASLLFEYDLSGKTVVPFCTHGGGGKARVLEDMAKMCPDASVFPGLSVYGDTGTRSQISAWLKEIGM